MDKKFDILNYLDRLTEHKVSSTQIKYICPVCHGNNLAVNIVSGKWKCWDDCDNFDIKKLLPLNYITIALLNLIDFLIKNKLPKYLIKYH